MVRLFVSIEFAAISNHFKSRVSRQFCCDLSFIIFYTLVYLYLLYLDDASRMVTLFDKS